MEKREKVDWKQTHLSICMLVILVILFAICTSAPNIFELRLILDEDTPAFVNAIETALLPVLQLQQLITLSQLLEL